MIDALKSDRPARRRAASRAKADRRVKVLTGLPGSASSARRVILPEIGNIDRFSSARKVPRLGPSRRTTQGRFDHLVAALQGARQKAR